MEKDLRWIKKHYGNTMVELCKELFKELLLYPGELPRILSELFPNNKYLADDIISQEQQLTFRQLVFSHCSVEVEEVVDLSGKTAVQLLSEQGYILYPECQTEEDIQFFRHFYDRRGEGETPIYVQGTTPEIYVGEELCTFSGGRLKKCRVWFAVKTNAEKIKREAFSHPERQDEYGTSVISIQFDRKTTSLSIKNRYNHTVEDPDYTFDNDLDNIIPGLEDAFDRDYGVRDLSMRNRAPAEFHLDGYVKVDGKYIKYNHKINGNYYCDDNIVIDRDLNIIKLPDGVMLIDYFIFDFKNKTISLYDKELSDCFVDGFKNIISFDLQGDTMTIKMQDKQDVVIKINAQSEIVSIIDPNLTTCGDKFLSYNNAATTVNLPNLTYCGSDFMSGNHKIRELIMPKLKICGFGFLRANQELTELNLPSLKYCGSSFLKLNENISSVNLPNLERCENDFLASNKNLTSICLPKLEICGDDFLYKNAQISKVDLPNLTNCDNDFLRFNENLKMLHLPKLKDCGSNFVALNEVMVELDLPNLKYAGDGFLNSNIALEKMNLPNLLSCGEFFLASNKELKVLDLPKLQFCKRYFFKKIK